MLTWGLVLSYLPRAARTVRDLRRVEEEKVCVFEIVELRKMFFEGFEMKEEVRLKVTGAEEGVWGVVYWNEVAAVAAAEMEAIRKDVGFWCEVLQYMESKTKQRSSNESGASDEDYYARALVDYEAETGTMFKLRHCWEILKGSPKWMQNEVPKFTAKSREGSKRYKTFGSSSFNTESVEASINLNANVGDDEEDEVQEIRRPIGKDNAKDVAKKKGSRASGSSSMNDEALARLMVTEMENQEKEERLAFLEIKMREVECREREVANHEYRQRQKDIRFYLQPYDHLVGDARAEMKSLRAKIKAKYNLPY
ncbi:zinc finger BED domain-containing protein RICESLEEPER 2-like protein [Tanacetum coccineum]